MNKLSLTVGYPDEMDVRTALIEEGYRLGSKAKLCRALGISRRYYNLIMEWRRAPVHPAILKYFGWTTVHACAEDIPMLQERQGHKRLASLTGKSHVRKGSMVRYTKRSTDPNQQGLFIL